ncbi:phosphoglycerate dehydrogenase [Desulfocurvus sp.]|jgi:D-3-phosphoglycerate dehydrogenase|uniref:phosphoglycerate dehydrogenase n=1 Tax=Desulfocurvus sp. TaxID=2871698 RepID=UPI0025B91E05|nr:phosphoglycerate dehydrogenase [Desulfocurvus sp.]MCK9240257.1 phosphoglycerate dehydrogenase [Desulfocurvus sp.]
MKIAITTSSFAAYGSEPLDLLARAGADVVTNPHGRKLRPEETVALLADCDGVVAGTEDLGAAVLERLPGLRAISRCGVGMDNVDLPWCEAHGVAVLNTPHGPTLAVAELTLGLILDLLRNVSRMDREMRAGTWKKRMGWQLAGKRVGVVGYGRIGRATGELLRAAGCEVASFDPRPTCPSTPCLPLDELLAWADIVTLHCSRPEGGCTVIGPAELARMRPGSWLVNCGRGGLVDEDALCAALESGRLCGAAVDCFGQEPYAGPLLRLDNVILTPHVGSYAREGRVRMEADAVRNLLAALGPDAQARR